MDSKGIFRRYNKEWNKIQREKKRQDKAFKRLNAIMERASRPRDYSGRKIKVNAFGEECVRVGNKWVLRSEAPNTYFPDPKDMVEPYLCDCKHCKAKRIRPFQMYYCLISYPVSYCYPEPLNIQDGQRTFISAYSG